jgi:hypothetical protein
VEEQREAIGMVWPDMMECAAAMNGTPTERCLHYVDPAAAMSIARDIMELERPGERLFVAYWRVWWTAASRLGQPVPAQTIVDHSLSAEDAQSALDALKRMAYVAYYGPDELAGTSLSPGYAAFIDCEGCQQWRSAWREGQHS